MPVRRVAWGNSAEVQMTQHLSYERTKVILRGNKPAVKTGCAHESARDILRDVTLQDGVAENSVIVVLIFAAQVQRI